MARDSPEDGVESLLDSGALFVRPPGFPDTGGDRPTAQDPPEDGVESLLGSEALFMRAPGVS